MYGVSNYLSLAIVLFLTMLVTHSLLYSISQNLDIIEKRINSENIPGGISVRVFDSTKYITINKSIVDNIIFIKGSYKVLINSTEILILYTNASEELVIVTEGDLYVV
ncbi:MAG: hypothetical protein B6U89_03935 [Desulfurococcales archaeon ex4484_58]|nr:MAG: hypothetical protein B6U89_03935 [Desulfurococcales archaeon ex4484_58]